MSRSLASHLALPALALAALVAAPARAEDPADARTAQARKELDALLDRWSDSTGDRLAQAVGICTGYLKAAKGEDKTGELDMRLELTRLHMAQNDFEAALADAQNANVAASESASPERKAEAKALYLLAYARSTQERMAKKIPQDVNSLSADDRKKLEAEQRKAGEEFQKSVGEQLKAIADLVGGDPAAKKLLGEQNERIATAAAINDLGKAPKPIEKPDTAGKMIRLSEYAVAPGKVVLVDFWATWCGPCMGELPNVLEVYSKYHDRGLEIVGISLDQDRAALDQCVRDRGMTWRQYFDGKGWENDISRAWGVVAIPRTYLIDHTGKVRYVNARGEGLAAAVKMLIERAEKAAGKDGSAPSAPKKGD